MAGFHHRVADSAACHRGPTEQIQTLLVAVITWHKSFLFWTKINAIDKSNKRIYTSSEENNGEFLPKHSTMIKEPGSSIWHKFCCLSSQAADRSAYITVALIMWEKMSYPECNDSEPPRKKQVSVSPRWLPILLERAYKLQNTAKSDKNLCSKGRGASCQSHQLVQRIIYHYHRTCKM